MAAADGTTIRVFIQKPEGGSVVVQLRPGDKISSLQDKLHEQLGIPATEQRLVYKSGELVSDRTVASYNIQHNGLIFLLIRLVGGMGCTPTTEAGRRGNETREQGSGVRGQSGSWFASRFSSSEQEATDP